MGIQGGKWVDAIELAIVGGDFLVEMKCRTSLYKL